MGLLNPLGRNWGELVNWDALGKFYISFAIAWTVILYSGAAWLYMHRHIPYLKMRNIPLALAAVTFLHIYLVKILLAYTTNGHFPCSVEFWIMSIYLPFGIAFFQANLSQLLSIATQQRRLLEGSRNVKNPQKGKWTVKELGARWKGMTPLVKTYVCIGIGMVCQVVVTAAIYGTNGKLQGHWGKLPKAKGQAQCRKGLEWIPSALWQLFFCCIYGPYLLYRIRHLRDTHFWRLQVMCSVVSGFPGSPLWLASVFSPAFKPVNKWWVPPLWLAPGIIVMQAVTIFFPIYEHRLTLRLSSRTLSLLATLSPPSQEKWDQTTQANSQAHTDSGKGSNAGTNTHPAPQSTSEADSCRANAEMYTLASLEKALIQNPGPLLTFAATKDFTAESILFLIAVRNFRLFCQQTGVTKEQLYSQAREIYYQSVSERTAEFPINIVSGIRGKLDAIFSCDGRNPSQRDFASGGPEARWDWDAEEEHRDKVSPFANVSAKDVPLSPLKGGNWGVDVVEAQLSPISRSDSNRPTTSSTLKHSEDGNGFIENVNEISSSQVDLNAKTAEDGITMGRDELERVFDRAEKSIKYLVVTNTWRKFVTENRGSMGMSQEA